VHVNIEESKLILSKIVRISPNISKLVHIKVGSFLDIIMLIHSTKQQSSHVYQQLHIWSVYHNIRNMSKILQLFMKS